MTEPVKGRRPTKPPQKSEFVTIAAITLSVLLVAGYIVWSKLQEPFILKAKFDYADGLKTGAEVQLAGVKVGSIKAIRFIGVPTDSSSKEIFEVILNIDPKINNQPAGELIRKDSEAVLILTGALGDRSINIEPGSSEAPPTKSGDYIRSRIEPTVSMLMDSYDAMNNNFNRVRDIIEGSINDINNYKGTVGKFYSRELNNNVELLVKDAETLQKEFERGKGSFGRFNSDKRLKESLDRLLDKTEKLRKNFEQGKGSAGKFAYDKEFQQRIDLLQARATRLSDLFDKIFERIEKGNGSLARFNKDEQFKRDFTQFQKSTDNISNMLTKRQGTAGLIAYDTRLSQNMDTISVELMKLIYDIRDKPRKYIKFKLF
jgi:phospholipid/cholesterol/gamma-HCH transport system substrate-binding protein